jgi:hypothetical protein
LLARSSSAYRNAAPPDRVNSLRTVRSSELQFGPFRAEYFNMIRIALMGICAVASVFLLTFLKALLQDSRDHAPRYTRTGTKAIVLIRRRRERESVTTRAA